LAIGLHVVFSKTDPFRKNFKMSSNLASIAIARTKERELELLLGLANRHGLITGATGTGKTVSLQVLAEGFSRAGVPVFMADVKGDLSGISQAGVIGPKMKVRLEQLGWSTPELSAFPVTLWDVFGEKGHPLRATVSDMGPLLLSRMLGLNETQEGVLHLVFKIADEQGMLLLDAKDLRAMLQYVGDNAKQFTTEYGNISAASIGAIQRGLMVLDQQGADQFFGEPMLNIDDLMQTDAQGRGVINVLTADRLLNAPRLYGSFLLWLLSDLFEHLPEVGDRDKPKLVFFFDEAHLLFNEAPRALLEKVEQVVRLIRSKGVGVYFVTQNPLDIPDSVLGQLGNRVQHALRAFTPRDQKAVQAAAETMRANPAFDTVQAISELGVGEALISFLDEKGRPCVVERAFVLPPSSRMGPLNDEEHKALMVNSVVAGVYDQTEDRESAFEKIKGRSANPRNATSSTAGQANPVQKGANETKSSTAPQSTSASSGGVDQNSSNPSEPALGDRIKDGVMGSLGGLMHGTGRKDSILESVAKSAARSIGTRIGSAIVRGVLGSLTRGR
jgi:uncharacterized protein